MSEWNCGPADAGKDVWGGGESSTNWNDGAGTNANDFGGDNSADANNFGIDADGGAAGADDKCFGCGEPGHRRAECPTAGDMACRYCKLPGHMVKDCPDKPPMICENCGEEGHMKRNCENARKVNRDHIASVTPEVAWAKMEQAVKERDTDDAKEGLQEYVKALDGAVTYKEIQESLIDKGINLWLIATERQLINVFSNMDLQGNMGKKYSISLRFSEKPERPREIDLWPTSREEILGRLDDAGEPVNNGQTKCHRCGEVGHMTKECSEERVEKPTKAPCYNCGTEGHRVRDCPEPRVDKFACKNCGQSGHRVADCEEPANLANVECRKCSEMGHFSKDCPQGGGSGCRNCGQDGHMAKDCDQPRNMDNVTCRNCEKTGHFSRECPEPRDWSKVQCSNCQKFGHTKVRCKEAPAEEAIDSGGFENTGFENTGFDNATPAHVDQGGGNDMWAATADAAPVSAGGW